MTSHSQIKNSAQDLLNLSRDATRIATTLAKLSGETTDEGEAERPPATDTPEVSLAAVSALIRSRRARTSYLPEELFFDPGWDILLDLFEAELMQRPIAVSNVCVATALPPTTALRWLKVLEEKQLIVRRGDPLDRRRIFVELTPKTSDALRRWFAQNASDAAPR